jgi:hypothetical protein
LNTVTPGHHGDRRSGNRWNAADGRDKRPDAAHGSAASSQIVPDLARILCGKRVRPYRSRLCINMQPDGLAKGADG